MQLERENNQFINKLDQNANRISTLLSIGSIFATLSVLAGAYTTNLNYVYAYAALSGFVTTTYLAGAIFCRRGRRALGMSFVLAGLILICALIPLGFLDMGLVIGFMLGFLVWQISLLTLEPHYVTVATTIGVISTLFIFVVDLYDPYQRLLIRELTIAAYIFVPLLIGAFLVIFYQNFNLYSIQTKLTTTTIAIAIIALGAALIILTISTRSGLTNSTQVELELRAESVTDEISTQFDRQIDRLVTLGTNQQIEAQVLADVADINDFEPEIVDVILESRNQIWVNEGSQFTLSRHFPFYSRLRNPLADLLRNYKRSFPETEQLFITNEYGAVVAMSNQSDTDKYLYDDTEWWQQIIKTDASQPYIGNPIQLPNSSALGIPIAVPLKDINNNLIGVIYSTYSVNQLITSLNLENAAQLETNFAMILGNDSLLPLVPGQNRIIDSPYSSSAIDELYQMNFLESRTFTFLSNSAGLSENNILTAVPFSTSVSEDSDQNNDGKRFIPLSWGVLVSRPLEVVESTIQEQQRIQVLFGVILIVITTMLASILARAVSAPILSLSAVAKRLEAGELSARAEVQSVDEVGSLSIAINQMAEQSQRLVNQLEIRVAERTQALETSFRVSQTISSITDRDNLVNSVVNQLQSAFDYYHVHIYLIDPPKKRLFLVAGSGEAGEQLVQENHSLEMGRGLVGRTALSNLPVIVSDVSRDPQWVANELLPETKSELAVPISLGDEVLGVIDVQENEVNRLSEQDADLLRSIAGQVAVALRNSEQIAIAQQRASLESRINAVREKILHTQDIKSAMKTAIREIGHVLGSKQATIRLQPAESRLLQETTPRESQIEINSGKRSGVSSNTKLNIKSGSSNGSHK